MFGLVYAVVRAADSSMNIIKPPSRKILRGTCIGMVLLIGVCSACEQNPRWDIKGGNPPQFVISGFGQLRSIIVYGPGEKRSTSDVEANGVKYWEIRPKDRFDLQPDGGRSTISYGEVPAGFVQLHPEGGLPPRPLFEGGRFGFSLLVEGGDEVNALFTLRGNNVVVEGY
jgi:hypothetical protein